MSKSLLFTVIFAVVILSLIIFFAKDAYLLMPGTLPKEMAVTPYESWQPFSHPYGKFTVKFPVSPQHAKDRIVDPKTQLVLTYNMYASEQGNGTVFMVNLITMASKQGKMSKEIMTDAIHNIVNSNPKNKLIQLQEGTFHQIPDIDFTIQNDPYLIHGKAFLQDQIVYILTVVANSKDFSEKDMDYFFNSFALQAPNPPAITPFPPEN